jgi:hypothetical protein
MFLFTIISTKQALIEITSIAIWNRNKVAMALAIGVWAMNVGFFIQGKSCLLHSIAEHMGHTALLGNSGCAGE